MMFSRSDSQATLLEAELAMGSWDNPEVCVSYLAVSQGASLSFLAGTYRLHFLELEKSGGFWVGLKHKV